MAEHAAGLARRNGVVTCGSVRARTTAAACLVVGAALVIGSIALLLALRHGLVSTGLDPPGNGARAGRRHRRPAPAADLADIGDDGVAQVVVRGRTGARGLVRAWRAGPISALGPADGASSSC